MPSLEPIRSDKGLALLSVLALVSALLVAGVATISLVRTQLHASADQVAAQGAYYIAEAGVQRAVAQLDHDAATAATSTYVNPTFATTSFGGGTYSVTMALDSTLFPGDYGRKRITSTGTLNGQTATLVAHALVQAPQDPCAQYVMVAAGGNARTIVKVSALSTFFNGDIHSNQDIDMNVLLALTPIMFQASGNLYAVRNFINDSLLSLAATLSANLYRGGSYTSAPLALHSDLLIPLGIHFTNGSGGHGVQQTVASKTLPTPDWNEAKRKADVIVNKDNYATAVPGSSWVSGSPYDIWSVSTWSIDPAKRYYVDGSVNIVGLRLANGAIPEIWARGRLSVNTLTLLGVGNTQTVKLVGESDVALGRALDLALGTLVSENSALGSITTGISLGASAAVGVATQTNIKAFSKSGEVWGLSTTAAALSKTGICFLAQSGQTTLAETVAIGSAVTKSM